MTPAKPGPSCSACSSHSEGGFRNGAFPDNFDDDNAGSIRQIAISYQENGDGGQTITGCLKR